MTTKDYFTERRLNLSNSKMDYINTDLHVRALEDALREIHIISTLAEGCDENNVEAVSCCIDAMGLISAKAKVMFDF